MTNPSNNPLNDDNGVPFLSRKLRRSKTDSWLTGVLGGVAETYGIDANVLRIIFVIACLVFPVAPIVYLVAAVLLWNT